MSKRFIVSMVALMVAAGSSIGLAQTWEHPWHGQGGVQGPAARRPAAAT